MVWGCSSGAGLGPFVPVEGTLNASAYQEMLDNSYTHVCIYVCIQNLLKCSDPFIVTCMNVPVNRLYHVCHCSCQSFCGVH